MDQETPVKLYKSDDRITLAAPLPGLEPEDITISVDSEGRITLQGEARGRLEGDKSVLMDEWDPGPYMRELQLHESVDATAANVTYQNGVLVLSLPLSDSPRPADLSLERVSATEGKRFGNAGRPAVPSPLGERDRAY